MILIEKKYHTENSRQDIQIITILHSKSKFNRVLELDSVFFLLNRGNNALGINKVLLLLAKWVSTLEVHV